MDILFKRRDIADFFEEKARLESVRQEYENRLEVCTRLLEGRIDIN